MIMSDYDTLSLTYRDTPVTPVTHKTSVDAPPDPKFLNLLMV